MNLKIDENTSISKFCESMVFIVLDPVTLIQRKDSEWTDKQKMLLIKSLVATDNNTYRRLNFYFQHRKDTSSVGIYDCRINPFNYKSAIGAVSFANPNA